VSKQVSEGSSTEQQDDTVAFDYIKSQDYRTVWADGVIGGVTPAGLVHFAAYSERPPIPQRQIFSVAETKADGRTLGPELYERRVARDAFVREMAIDIMMSPAVAESVANWLLDQVKVINLINEAKT
jgi:hypothetical protein